MLTFRLLQGEARQPGTGWETGLTRLQQNSRREPSSKSSAMHSWILLNCMPTSDLPWMTARSSSIGNTSERKFWLRWVCRIRLERFIRRLAVFGLKRYIRRVLFVTLDKSEKTFSPSTRYEDFALSPTRFHWQSQSTTGENLRPVDGTSASARTALGSCCSSDRKRAMHLCSSGLCDTFRIREAAP